MIRQVQDSPAGDGPGAQPSPPAYLRFGFGLSQSGGDVGARLQAGTPGGDADQVTVRCSARNRSTEQGGATSVIRRALSPPVRAALRRGLGARDHRVAARTATAVLLLVAAVLAFFSVIDLGDNTVAEHLGIWTVIVVVSFIAVLLQVTDPRLLDGAGLFTAVPTAGALLVCGLNAFTADTSAAAQVFVLLPTLWASSQLRVAGAWIVAVVAALGHTCVVVSLEPLSEALPDVAFVAITLALATGLLAHAGERQEVLVDALRRQAAVDPLTGLVTRRVLDDALASALSASAGQGTALVLVDVDWFKAVNDGYGHPVGDDALRHLGEVLRRVVRDTDAVVSRMGGDELAILLPGCPAEAAERRAQDLVRAVRATPLPLVAGGSLPLTVSVGVAHAPEHAWGLRPLYTAADAALYEAKRAGRNCVGVADGRTVGVVDVA